MIRTMMESLAILQTRLVLGDECVKKMATNIPTRTRGRLMQRHPNQTAGMLSD
jgi:hypothetical protein